MTLALAALILLQAADPGAEVRTVTLTVVDEKGAPVEGLALEEVALLENGVAREVTRLEPERRPLRLALIVDSSEEISSIFRLHLVDAVVGFLKKLPEGARFMLWATGDRPRKILDLGDDVGAAAKALRRVVPQGGNTVLDALAEASRELKKQEGARTAVVVVTGRTTNTGNRDRYRAVEDAEKNAELFLAVQFDEGQAGFETRMDYEYALSTLAKRSGGANESPLSSMAVGHVLQRLAGRLRGSYRLSYATLPELKGRKLELQVARPGARAFLGVAR